MLPLVEGAKDDLEEAREGFVVCETHLRESPTWLDCQERWVHLPKLPGLKISLPSPPTFVLALPFVRLNHLACDVDDSGRPQPLLLRPDSKSRG